VVLLCWRRDPSEVKIQPTSSSRIYLIHVSFTIPKVKLINVIRHVYMHESDISFLFFVYIRANYILQNVPILTLYKLKCLFVFYYYYFCARPYR